CRTRWFSDFAMRSLLSICQVLPSLIAGNLVLPRCGLHPSSTMMPPPASVFDPTTTIGLAPMTIKNYLVALKTALGWAVQQKLITYVPNFRGLAWPVRTLLGGENSPAVFCSRDHKSAQARFFLARAWQRSRVPRDLLRLGLLGRAEDVNGSFNRCLSGQAHKLADAVPTLARAEGHMPAVQRAVRLRP